MFSFGRLLTKVLKSCRWYTVMWSVMSDQTIRVWLKTTCSTSNTWQTTGWTVGPHSTVNDLNNLKRCTQKENLSSLDTLNGDRFEIWEIWPTRRFTNILLEGVHGGHGPQQKPFIYFNKVAIISIIIVGKVFNNRDGPLSWTTRKLKWE